MSAASNFENPDPDETLVRGQRATSAVAPETGTSSRIGPYRLLQLIGEGGMGEVWLAEQLEPVRRKVALKVIKAGMDTKQVVARFESERQALALMDHPAIAKVFDGGSTPEGRPYFVMEYVAGVPITEHCDTHKLSTTARLELFTQVCEGVQHAHQKAIIHRDLKPSNILVSLVDGKAQPKIIDFGIAKATGYRLTEKTLFTEVGAVIGTLEYMSPEQADLTGQDVDTRTDVYSLGVLLYQLLTGELPFSSKDLRSSSYEELRRKLKEDEPPAPSTRLSTLKEGAAEAAKNRNMDSDVLQRQLEGDLDAITMKALEKDRARRYGTPSDLAQDIERHLCHEPVVARPASTAYRLQKYLKRHRVGVWFATGLAALLVAFAVTMAVQARRTALERDRANAERDRANREKEASERVSLFLENMLGTLKPQALGSALWKDLHDGVVAASRRRREAEENVASNLASLDTALAGVNPTETALHLLDGQILEPAGKTLRRDMGSEPRIAGSLEYTLAGTYENLGLYPQAEQHAKRAVELRIGALGPEDVDTLQAMNELANVYIREGQLKEAEKLHHEVLRTRRRLLGPEHPDTLRSMSNLSVVDMQIGHYEEAESLIRETFQVKRRVLGPDHPDTLNSMSNLAVVSMQLGRYAESEKLGRELLATLRRVKGPEDPSTLGALHNLAEVTAAQGQYGEAEKLDKELIDAERRVLGPEHPYTLGSMSDLGALYMQQGRYDDAEKLDRETVELQRRNLGPEHLETLSTMNDLASALEAQRRFHEADKLFLEALEAERRVLGPEHPKTLQSFFSLADSYTDQGRYGEAKTFADEAVTGYERTKFEENELIGGARLALGRALTGLKRYAEAEPTLLAAEHQLSATKGMTRKKCLEALVTLYEAWEKAAPGTGQAARAATWKAKLASTE